MQTQLARRARQFLPEPQRRASPVAWPRRALHSPARSLASAQPSPAVSARCAAAVNRPAPTDRAHSGHGSGLSGESCFSLIGSLSRSLARSNVTGARVLLGSNYRNAQSNSQDEKRERERGASELGSDGRHCHWCGRGERAEAGRGASECLVLVLVPVPVGAHTPRDGRAARARDRAVEDGGREQTSLAREAFRSSRERGRLLLRERGRKRSEGRRR